MKKMNKKGFTLVEMLVVIAIIAVLVSILVPTVLGATKKAKAATDAANLRSAMAEFEINMLGKGKNVEAGTYTHSKTFTGESTATTLFNSVASKTDATNGKGIIIVVDTNGKITAGFGDDTAASPSIYTGLDLDTLANIAGGNG